MSQQRWRKVDLYPKGSVRSWVKALEDFSPLCFSFYYIPWTLKSRLKACQKWKVLNEASEKSVVHRRRHAWLCVLRVLSNSLYIMCSAFQIPFYKQMCEGIQAGEMCEKLVGYSAVYKVCFGMACFFFLFFLFTIKINSSKSCRAYIHNGWVFCLIA